MPSAYLLILGLCLFALAYRYYGAFLSAKVAVLDPKRPTPAHAQRDGRDYHPTNRWVLFGHHFAAIAGAGPLIGPVLAAQYGYLPGALWILIGAIFIGAVQDFIILYASVRNRGESISKIADRYLGPVAGWCTAVAVVFIIVVALAGLALAVVNALNESPWGAFTIACSIPIAFLMGQWMYRIRPGRITEASIIGVGLLLLAVIAGGRVGGSIIGPWFKMSKVSLEVGLGTYGFVAAVLPVWMLLCPRDYLSTYMKLGTVALLAVGIFVVGPTLRAPALTADIYGGGKVIPGPVWPWVCLTIACGAISGFHALIGSGTSPKMINNEADIRPIGYGAMLVEGFVGLLALVAACTLHREHYLIITAKDYHAAQADMDYVSALARQMGETTLVGRTGGSVTLAVGMSDVLSRIPGMSRLMAYWYHFAVMFEALFILTTVDTGTRVARFIVQEMLGRVYRPLGEGRWLPGVIFTSFLVTYAWVCLLHGGTISTIWPMFGIANQLLGGIALAIGTTYILRHAQRKAYALVTVIPCVFMMVTVLTSGVQFTQRMLTLPSPDGDPVKAILTIVMMVLAVIICGDSVVKWRRILCGTCGPLPEYEPEGDLMKLAEGTEVSE